MALNVVSGILLVPLFVGLLLLQVFRVFLVERDAAQHRAESIPRERAADNDKE